MSQVKQGTSFRGDVLRLVSGTAGAQALSALAAPLLARLFTPGDYGMLAVYSSLLALVSVVACLRYELAIPLPESEQDAADLVGVCLLCVGLASVLSSGVVLVWGEVACVRLGVPRLAGYMWLLPVGVLLGGLYTTFNYWCTRTKRFGTIANTRWKQSLAAILIQCGAFKLGALALLLGQVAGQSAGALSLARPVYRLSVFKRVSIPGLGAVIRRYRRFPLYSLGAGLANTGSLQLPPLMFAAFFGSSSAGIYALSYRILQLPMTLVGNAIGQVFFANAVEARRDGFLGKLVADLHRKLAYLGLPPSLILIFSGPELFAFVFGEEWRMAGECARWLAPWLYLVFVSSPMSTLFSVVERQDQSLTFQLVLLVARCGAIVLGAQFGGFLFSLKVFAGVSTVCLIGFLLWLGRMAGNRTDVMIRPSLSALMWGAVCVAPLLVVFIFGYTSQIIILAATVLSGLITLGHYWRMAIQEGI